MMQEIAEQNRAAATITREEISFLLRDGVERRAAPGTGREVWSNAAREARKNMMEEAND
jgi:hypothetical protein